MRGTLISEPGYVTVIETPACYEEQIRPILERTPVMSCLDEMIALTSVDDLRASPGGEPLIQIFPTDGLGAFLMIPRPEVHPATESWSFARMRREGRFAFVAFWIHPEWSGGDWAERALSFAATQRGGTGSPLTKPRPSARTKPEGYLHTIRDLGSPAEIAMLKRLRGEIRSFVQKHFGVEPKLFVQYPNGAIKSTLHVQVWHGHREGDDESGRKIALDAVIEEAEAAGRAWSTRRHFRYRLHTASGAYRLIESLPHARVASRTLLVGVRARHVCRAHGALVFEDGALLQLIHTAEMQRLRRVLQYGPASLLGGAERVTRFEHSLGVWSLVKGLGASREEQVAALLHDVTHGAFSHAIDPALVDVPGAGSPHDVEAISLLERTGLPERLTTLLPGLDDWRLLFDKSRYPLLAAPSPGLCADRLDNILRDALVLGITTPQDIRHHLTSLAVAPDGGMVFRRVEAAQWLLGCIREANQRLYSHPRNLGLCWVIAEMIRRAIEAGILQREQLFALGDAEVWARLQNVEALGDLAHMVSAETERIAAGAPSVFEVEGLPRAGASPLARVERRYRVIDPAVELDGRVQPLSAWDETAALTIERLRERSGVVELYLTSALGGRRA